MKRGAVAVVPDDKLSLAIGRDGQNARLAARLTGWKIDVKSFSAAEKMNLFGNEEEEDADESGDVAEEEAQTAGEVVKAAEEESAVPAEENAEDPAKRRMNPPKTRKKKANNGKDEIRPRQNVHRPAAR